MPDASWETQCRTLQIQSSHRNIQGCEMVGSAACSLVFSPDSTNKGSSHAYFERNAIFISSELA